MKSHPADNYWNHLKIYTDGSVLENKQASSRFVIPEFKTEKGFYLGKGMSLFTAELVALLVTVSYIFNLLVALFNILFSVDSKALNITDSKVRSDIIYEIKHFVHCLLTKVQVSLSVGFLHKCGLTFNE